MDSGPDIAVDFARGHQRLDGDMAEIVGFLGAVASELSWGSLARHNRPGHWLHARAREFDSLARRIRTDDRFSWWWDASARHVITAKDTGTAPWSALDEQSWSVQPYGPSVIQTTPGPCGSAPSVLAVCVDNNTELDGDHATVPFEPAGTIWRITTESDWVALLDIEREVVTNRQILKDWSEFLGEPESVWVQPRWSAVFAEFDAVEVTLGGFLTTAYRRIPTAYGTTAVIGWNPGARVWGDKARYVASSSKAPGSPGVN